jgi:cytochrome c oxidase subunit III
MVAASESMESIPPEIGEWELPSRRAVGMACLIATESALFSVFVIAYLFYMGKSLTGPFPADVLEMPILATICLLSSSLTIVLAERGLHKGSMGQFKLWWLLTILLAAEFLGATAYEWYELIRLEHFTISTNLFGTTYYSLVGLHGSHVIVGLVLLVTVFYFGVRGHDLHPHAERIKMISWYWHFVDAVWVVVFTVVYVVGR